MKYIVSLAALLLVGSAAAQTVSLYKVQNRFPIAGTDGWDYITVDSDARRIYVSHGIRVNVLDADTGKKTGRILLPAATVVITPATDATQKPKRVITEGTFAVLVVGK